MAAAPTPAPSVYFSTADRLYPTSLYEANTLLWNSKLKEAEELLRPHATARPREALEYAFVHINRTFVTAAREDKEEVAVRLEKAEEIANAFVSNPALRATLHSANATAEERDNVLLDCKLAAAEALGCRAITQFTLGRWIKGPINLRSAWVAYSALQKELQAKKHAHREIVDGLHYGLGIFYFAMSFAPGMLKSVLELIGFVSDRELGLRYFGDVFQNSGLRAPMTSMFLSLNYLIIPRGLSRLEDMVKAAEPIITTQVQRYPEGGSFLWLHSLLQLKKGEIRTSIEIIKRAIDCARHIASVPNGYYVNLAAAHFMLREWSAAAEVLSLITAPGSKEFEMKGLCGLQLATCYHMMGDKEKCAAALARVPEMAKNSRFEALVLRKLRRAQRGVFFGPFELMYLRRDLHHMKSNDLAPHLDALEDSKKKSGAMNENDVAVYLLCKGAILRGLQQDADAVKIFEELLQMERMIADDTWVLPNACQELAEIAYFGGKHDHTETMLKRAMSYSNYDYHEVVHNRARLSLEQVQKERKEREKSTVTF